MEDGKMQNTAKANIDMNTRYDHRRNAFKNEVTEVPRPYPDKDITEGEVQAAIKKLYTGKHAG